MNLNITLIRGGVMATALFATAGVTLAEPATATRNVNVRTGPGLNYQVVDQLVKGQPVDRGTCNDDGTWCYVRHDGDDGWVADVFLATQTPTPPSSNGDANYAAIRQLNVRSGPGTQFDVVDRLGRGDQVARGQCTDNGAWCYIDHDGTNGWVSARFIQPIEPEAPVSPPSGGTGDRYYASTALNVRSGPDTSFGVVDRLTAGEAVDRGQCVNNGSWCFIEHDGPDGWVSSRFLLAERPTPPHNGGNRPGNGGNNNNGGQRPGGGQTQTETVQVGTAVTNIPVRPSPTLFTSVSGQLQRGDTIDIERCDAQNIWCQFDYNGDEGWVMSAFLNIRTIEREVEVPANMAITKARIALRSGPGRNHAVIGVVQANQEVEILTCGPAGNWCQIEGQNGRQGWVSSAFLQVPDAEPAPPEQPAQQQPNQVCFTGFGNVRICLQ